MILFYVDDSGDTNPHHEPLLDGETPLFCLSAVALRSTLWRDYDRSLLALKRTFFRTEMNAYVQANPGRRPEHFEVKGRDLVQPSHATDRRRRKFLGRVFALCQRLEARFFSAIWKKSPTNPGNPQGLYTRSLQLLAERFQYYCEEQNDEGIMVVDSRNRVLDLQVGTSHLSFVFGHLTGRTLTRLTEAPMFADSVLSAGIQIADIIGACIYGYYYHRRCSSVPGLYDGSRPVSPQALASPPPGGYQVLTPARDYSHCASYWAQLDALQFKRSDVPPPIPGTPVPSYYGFREAQ